jgi:flagellar motor switch/type III secretory pathway protein FliN
MAQPALHSPPHLPFALLGADVLRAVHGLLEQAVHDWCADWGVARDELVLETLRAWEALDQLPAAPAWRRPWQAAAGGMALAWPEEWPAQLRRLLFAPDRPYAPAAGGAGIAMAAADAAWLELQRALAAVAVPGGGQGADAMPPSPADWRHASGALLLAIRLGKQTCLALLNHDAVRALARQAALRGVVQPSAAAPLAALDYRALLAPLEVALPVEIGRAEVGLGSLMRLEAGDVIRLDTAADRALRVTGPSGAVLFDGYLGLADGHVALELVQHDLTFGVQP